MLVLGLPRVTDIYGVTECFAGTYPFAMLTLWRIQRLRFPITAKTAWIYR